MCNKWRAPTSEGRVVAKKAVARWEWDRIHSQLSCTGGWSINEKAMRVEKLVERVAAAGGLSDTVHVRAV